MDPFASSSTSSESRNPHPQATAAPAPAVPSSNSISGDSRPGNHHHAQHAHHHSATLPLLPTPPRIMEADDDFEHDSTFGGDRESLASSSTSLQSEVTRYQYEHGRRYHGYRAGLYLFPNDEEELNRMDIEHQNCLIQLDGRLHLCPLEDPKEILDLGTGTGLWAIDMADQYPDCDVLGIDLSPVQPVWIPPNCQFLVDDYEQQWTFGEERFDMIHMRYLCGSITTYDELYKRAYAALKPGGWVEIVDIECGNYCDDGSLPEDAPSVKWWAMLQESFEKLGKQFPKCDDYPKMLEAAGFDNVTYQMLKRPTNDWPKDPKMKEVGKYTCLNFLEGLDGWSNVPMTRGLGWQIEEVKVLNALVKKETVTRKYHGWQKGCIVYAQRPLITPATK